jgi:hypothetical protein
MGTYPWGPHGPQSGPNQVTPNPTPSYVPPPPQAPYVPPSGPGFGGGGQVPVQYTGTIATGPRKKGYIVALILALFFGPLGLFYASKKGALILLAILATVPLVLSFGGMLPGGVPRNPFEVWSYDFVMDPIWAVLVVVSAIWAIFGVRAFNKAQS